MSERRVFLIFIGAFALLWAAPLEPARDLGALYEALALAQWYAREHVLLCLIPAFFIAGAIACFVSQDAVMTYLGPRARRVVAYGVASASGTILAVCSCTVLPLFAGIYRRGAGLGPATAFLYSGPAINVLAIILTARVLGVEIGIARAVGAVVFAVVIGLIMAFVFRKEEAEAAAMAQDMPAPEATRRPGQDLLYFGAMVGVLVFANWAAPRAGEGGIWQTIHGLKWWLTGASGALLTFALWRWFRRDEIVTWGESSWEYARMILPLLLAGVFVAGLLLGRPGHEGLIPSTWVASLVGGNSLGANLAASVFGAFMYFATLTEVPILEGLLGAGMGKGPALALLLAGPALSLPNMLVIRGVLGTKKTAVFVGLVIVMATLSGLIYGAIAG
jgi:uncharacterized protein